MRQDDSYFVGSLFSIDSKDWIILAIIIPIAHQVYVLLGWRTELFYKFITKQFGESGFLYFKIGFLLLFLSRLVSIVFLDYANRGSIFINDYLVYAMSFIFGGLSLYLFYSVINYFGIDRAIGKDHFEPDVFRSIAFVKKGIFRFSSNSMYVFGFLILWLPGIVLESKAALLMALFNHLYIWVHYYYTESPDIEIIYSD